jgi:Flp pilus assembly protein TadD
VSGGERQVTAWAVRSRIEAGAVSAARPMYEALHGRLGPVTDVLVVEGLLNEAEGNLEAAIGSLRRALVDSPRSVSANSQLARILVRLDNLVEAEAAAVATLRLEASNANALWALADVYARTGRLEERVELVHRLGLSPGVSDDAIWDVVIELSLAGRWTEILEILDRRGAELRPARVIAERTQALIELGRHRAALAVLVAGLVDGHVRPREAVDRLIAHQALAVGAAFVERAIEDGYSEPGERTALVMAARRMCDATTLQDSPYAFADAVRALEILLPDRESLPKAVARSAAFLVKRARDRIAEGDYAAATEELIRAGRLKPHDRPILEMLADAALRAGRSHRHFDTLLRIHQLFPDGSSLVALAEAAHAAMDWTALAELISRATPGMLAGADAPIERLRVQVRRTFESLLHERNFVAGLGLVTRLRPWLDMADWPGPSIDRLLAGVKRHLRGLRPFADGGAMTRICLSYLSIDAADLDVGRLLARLHLRNRRFKEAADVLAGVLRADPHSARDWADLALAWQELEQPALRDACMAHARIIAPAMAMSKPLGAARAQQSST